MDFVTPIAIAKQALDALQNLRKVEKALDEATLKAELAEVTSKMADVRMALVDAKDDAAAKDAEINRLKKSFETKNALVTYHQQKYFRSEADPTKPVGLPICPRCEEVDGRIILMRSGERGMSAKCPQCKTDYHHVQRWSEPQSAP
jgi:hypothetical protein